MDNKMERREEAEASSSVYRKKHKVETTPQTVLAASEALEPKKLKKDKKRKKQTEESGQDETAALHKETETPEKKVVEHECCNEDHDVYMKNPQTIFVKGFDCSLPRKDIESALVKHFRSCGPVLCVFIPFHCKTGCPVGFAFMNLAADAKKVLALDGSYLGRMKLKVAMAIKRKEYYGYKYEGCERCAMAIMQRISKRFYQPIGIQLTKQQREEIANIQKAAIAEKKAAKAKKHK